MLAKIEQLSSITVNVLETRCTVLYAAPCSPLWQREQLRVTHHRGLLRFMILFVQSELQNELY